jgi:rod shape-determining protein MreD
VKSGRIALLLVAATALQFLAGGSQHRGVWPADFLLIVTAVVARAGDFVRAVFVGGAVGFLEDGLNHDLLGMNAFAKAALGYVLALLSVRVIFGGAWAVGLALTLSSLANDAIVAALAWLLLKAPVVLFSRSALWRAAATGATAAMLEAAWNFPWREWWEKRQMGRPR